MKIVGGSGVLLVAGEAFGWRPWETGGTEGKEGGNMRLVNEKGQWEVGDDAWGLLGLVWPKPGIYIPFYMHPVWRQQDTRRFEWRSADLWQIY